MRIESGEIDLYAVLHITPTAHPAIVQAAYRALARMLHPDQAAAEDRAMVMVNRAYAVLRDPERRSAYDASRAQHAAPPVAAPSSPMSPVESQERTPDGLKARGRGTVLSYGRYAGWSLEQLADRDPDYLRWLSRHTSGLRYRTRIEELLSGQASPAAAGAGRQRRPAWRR